MTSCTHFSNQSSTVCPVLKKAKKAVCLQDPLVMTPDVF